LVVDVGRTVEILGVEVLELFDRSLTVLRYNDATSQAEASESYNYRQKGRRDSQCSLASTAAFCFHDVALYVLGFLMSSSRRAIELLIAKAFVTPGPLGRHAKRPSFKGRTSRRSAE
jgi:hypothetical protein